MKNNFLRVIALILTVSLLTVLFSSCGKKTPSSSQVSSIISDDSSAINGADTVSVSSIVSGSTSGSTSGTTNTLMKDTSDLPTYTGKPLTINYWNASGTGGNRRITKSPSDVVTPEIKRVTGVTVNEEESFDNGGQPYKTKLALLTTSKNFPTVAIGVQNMSDLINKDLIYDLTDYINKYAPNLKRLTFDNPKYLDLYKVNISTTGKLYSLPYYITSTTYMELNKSAVDMAKYSYFVKQPDPSGGQFVFVRDDILKKIYPTAKTEKEIESLWIKNGKFTKAEVLDVPIKSKDDFYNFLKKVKALNLTENGRPVYPIFVHSGQDTYALLSGLGPMLNGWGSVACSYFTYWDKKTKQVEMMMPKAEFKDTVKFMNNLVREGLSDKDCLSDTYSTTMEKLNRGEYAVAYAYLQPNNELLKSSGKAFQYRKLYLDIPIDSSRFIDYYSYGLSTGDQMVIFKKSATPDQVIQIVKWFDYLVSEYGQKLYAWGPRSAGLFTETNGIRQFKDQALVDNLVNGVDNNKAQQYNIWSPYGTPSVVSDKLKIYYVMDGKNMYAPQLYYPAKPKGSDAFTNFNWGITEPRQLLPPITTPQIWFFSGRGFDRIDKFWGSRKLMEDQLLKCLAVNNDVEFEGQWAKVIDGLNQAGYSSELMDDFNNINKNILNKTTWDNLINLK